MPQEKFSQSQAPYLHCPSLPPLPWLGDGQLNLSPQSLVLRAPARPTTGWSGASALRLLPT